MSWTQITDPCGNLGLSASAAAPAASVVAAKVPAPPAFPADGVAYLAITAAAVLLVTIFARVTGKERAIE